MKIILLTFLLSGCAVLAQTPAGSDGDDAAAREQLLREAVRQKIAATSARTNPPAAVVVPAAAASTPPASVVVPPTVPVTPPSAAAVVAAPAAVNTPVPGNPPPMAIPVAPSATPTAAVPPTIPVIPTATATAVPAPGVPQPGTLPPVAGAPATPPPDATSSPGAAPVVPKAKPAEPADRDINWSAVDIDQILGYYAGLVGRSVLKPASLAAPTITFRTVTPLTRTEAIQAIDSLLAMNGISTINVGDKFVKVVPSAQAFTAAGTFSLVDSTNLPEPGGYVTRIVPIQYAKPSDLVQLLSSFSLIPNSIQALDSNQLLIIRDNSENIKRMMELIAKVDVAVPAEIDSEVIPIKYALASDIASALGSLGGGTGASVGRSATPTPAPGTPTMNRPGSLGGAGGGMPGSPGYQPGSTPGTGAGALAAPRATSLQDRLRQIVSKAANSGDFQILGNTKIIADERTNSLLVFAGRQDMEMIKSIINKLDVVLAQVLIQAIIMEVTLNDNKSLGVSYLQKNESKGGNYFNGIGGVNNGAFLNRGNFSPSSGTNGGPSIASGLSYFANFGGDFQASLTAAADDGRVNIMSSPSIQTSHAVPCSLQIGQTVPYVTGTYFNGVNGTPSSQYQQTFVGINLQVTPLINPDGLVVMDITQDIQDLGPTTKIDNNDVPTTTKRTAQAKVSVMDGDTIILGGFISTTKNTSKSGVPFLKDVPGLGLLFSSSSEKKSRQELIVLIKPTVLPNPTNAAVLARRVRDNSPALKGVEAENRADEISRRKAADKIIIPTEKR